MKGMFIPEITVEMFRNACLESIETLMAEGEVYDIDYEPEQRWISVSERLPDIKENHVSEPCIVYCENGAYGFTELEENIFGQVGWYCEREDDFHESLGKVLAWMPVPKPYQEDKDGK